MITKISWKSLLIIVILMGGLGACANIAVRVAGGLKKNISCEDLIAWSGKVVREYPEGQRRRREPNYEEKTKKLFNDPQFIDVFGEPYDQLSSLQRKNLDRNIINGCVNSRKYIKSFDGHKLSAMHYFRVKEKNGGYKALLSHIEKSRKEHEWLRNKSVEISNIEAVEDNFYTLEKLYQTAYGELTHLWPSEIEKFRGLVNNKRRETAYAIMMAWVSRMKQLDPTLKNAIFVSGNLKAHKRYMDLLDSSGQNAIYKEKINIIHAKLKPGLDRRLRSMDEWTNSWESILDASKEHRKLEIDYRQFIHYAAVTEASATMGKRRNDLIESVKPELIAWMEALPLTKKGSDELDSFYNSLFLAGPGFTMPLYYTLAKDRNAKQAKIDRAILGRRIAIFWNVETDFPLNGYMYPGLIKGVYGKKYDALPDDSETRKVVTGFARAIISGCQKMGILQGLSLMNYWVPNLEQAGLNVLEEFMKVYKSDDLSSLARNALGAKLKLMNAFGDGGYRDGKIFIERYGCSSSRTVSFGRKLLSLINYKTSKTPERFNKALHGALFGIAIR